MSTIPEIRKFSLTFLINQLIALPFFMATFGMLSVGRAQSYSYATVYGTRNTSFSAPFPIAMGSDTQSAKKPSMVGLTDT